MPKTSVEIQWANGDYSFALKAKQIEELEHLCDAGIGRIAMAVFSKVDYKFKYLREAIRLGLIGGGVAPVEAKRLVEMYVDDEPIDPVDNLSSTFKTACAIYQAVYFGFEQLPEALEPGEAEAR